MSPRSSCPHPMVLCLALLSACTNDPEASGDPAPGSEGTPPVAVEPVATGEASPTAATSTTPAMLDRFTSPLENGAALRELIAVDWELEPGTEKYLCVRLTLTETTFVNSWSAEAPVGTHHILLTTSAQPDGKPDGVSECDAGTLGLQLVFVTGVGEVDFTLPSGLAMKLPQGGQALLNLHLFNPTDKPLRGRSGARIQSVQEKDVRDVADVFNVLSLKIDVPPGRSTSYAKCTVDRDTTVLAVAPHMHEKGVALKAVAHSAMQGDVMLFDGPFDFQNQTGYPVGPLQFKAGDIIDVACTFENPTNKTLHFGDSSTEAEMCVLGVVRYPAGGPSLCAK